MLLSLIRQASRLPVIYDKSVFLDHAISSVIKGRYLKDWEYRGKSTSLFSSTSREPVSKQLLVTSGFEQIRKYFQKLKYLAIPLLENVWDALTDKLNQNIHCFHINTDTYLSYIHKNCTTTGCDYSHFFSQKNPTPTGTSKKRVPHGRIFPCRVHCLLKLQAIPFGLSCLITLMLTSSQSFIPTFTICSRRTLI